MSVASVGPFFLGYLYPLSVVVGGLHGGWAVWLTNLISLAIYPILDAIPGESADAPGAVPAVSRPSWHCAPIWLLVPVQLGLTVWVIAGVAHGRWRGWEAVGMTYSLGLTAGTVGITYAHELIHRSSAGERGLGLTLLGLVSYMHFRLSHVYVHHKHVATPEDAATARLGENVYAFYGRSIAGGVRDAWRVERRRQLARGQRPLGWGNRFLRYLWIQAAIYAGVALGFGWRGVVVFAGQSLAAILVLETINYVQHYGLVRRRLSTGRYERVSVEHSWSTGRRLTNLDLANLGKHADHHAHESRRYEDLRHIAGAPELPAGYFTMAFVALVPPLWRRVMDPRVARLR